MHNAPYFNRVSPYSTQVRDDDIDILVLLLFCSPIMFSLVRPANSLNDIQRLPVKAYLFRSPNLIFKYLAFDCWLELNFFLVYSFQHQLNSSSRTLSEAIGKWVLLMRGVRTLWGATITDKSTKFAYICGLLLHNCNNNEMRPRVIFSGIKEKFFDLSTLIQLFDCTRLHLVALV